MGLQGRYASADYDMCEFDVLGESNWYMLTNSNHRVPDGTIPMKEGKPMLQFSHEPDGTLSAHPMRVVYKTSQSSIASFLKAAKLPPQASTLLLLKRPPLTLMSGSTSESMASITTSRKLKQTHPLDDSRSCPAILNQ